MSSWFNFCTENLQKRCCRYLLQRYVGRFLKRKIEPDQLSINVLDGAVSIEDIVLDVQALNDVGDEHQLPFEFVEGSVDKISLSVPWRNMLKESSTIHVDGLCLTVRPNVKETEGIPSSMLESVWSSMSNSVYSSPDSDYEESFDNAPESEQVSGLEVFIQAIESILNRIKVKFSNTVIKLEYMPDFMKLGLGLQLHIISLDYIDEDESKEGIMYDSLAFLTKKLVIEGVFLQTYEFKCPKSNKGPISKTNITDPITIAELTGTQIIQMVLKHNPSLPGPKLSLEINFGPLNVICSPRQLYLVIEILRGISMPLTEQQQSAPVQKPMSESDFNRIELDLYNRVESRPDVSLRGMQGWSNLQDDEEEFFPLHGIKNKTFAPSMDSSMTSSISSVASSKSDLSSRYSRHKNKGKNEWLGETNHFNVKLTSLCVVLLHEDILAVCPETDLITQCSLNEMRKISHQYLMAVQNADIIKECDKITNSLERNHLKLVTLNVIMEGDEKTNETVKDVNITASGANVVITEVLIKTAEESTQYIPILKFVRNNKCPTKIPSTSSNQQDIYVQFKHNTKSTRYCNPVSSEIKITMQEAFSEVDISIINRLSSYIYSPDFKISKKSPLNVYQPQFNEVIESMNDTNMKCTLNFNHLVIKFRFPVPDLRPLSDINRLPWWKRILRDDILWLYLSDAECSITKTSQQTTGYEAQCKTVEALFQEANSKNIIPIAKCKGFDDDLKTIRMDSKHRPKLVLRICPVVSNHSDIKVDNFDVERNMTSSVYVESSKKPSPFASKKIMRQRNHHSNSNEQEHKLSDGEVQVVPGSREEIMEFVENTNANAKVYLDINVPYLFITLPSKHLYEIIYNRFTNDLFFWSPSFPTPASYGDESDRLSHILDRTRYFAPCKSGIQFDSESESDDEDTANTYYSCGQSTLNIADPLIKRTEFCLTLNVAQCLFTIIIQSRDRSGRVIPQHYGELQIKFDDLYLYLAAGFENTPRHNFICIQANKFCLSHENLSTNGSDILTPKEVVCQKNKSLKRVLYKIPEGMDFKERTDVDHSDMLTVVVEISVCNHIKTIRVANEMHGTALRHIFCVVAQSWYYQLSDFFDVVDYPVAGYESPHVITELHQHFSECLIDYRPLYLPYQCVLTIGNFSLSSNIVARSKTSTLQIVSEDVALFISARLSKAENLDLMSNYICVMDLGVFELSLKLCKASNQSNNTVSQPEVDLRMAVNVIHIRTCADSAFAFCRLLSYLASDGDKSCVEDQTNEFEGVDQEEPPLFDQCDSDNNSLSSLILEAMNEETVIKKKANDPVNTIKIPNSNTSPTHSQSGKGIEVFYFPDETNKIVTSADSHSPLQFDIDDEYIEKEFCFVEHEAGSGVMPRSEIPEVRMLTDTQIRLVNNYFKAPVGKIDMLQAPKEYPIPLVRYTLREMTLIWHIYGGTDFGTKIAYNELAKHVTIVSETNSCPTSPNILRPSLSRYYSQTHIESQKNPIANKKSANISQARTRFCCSILPTSWQAKGGPDRQHHVLMQLQLNKVRFQHEVYPLHTKQAMRQVILIQDLEIRDKLASSNINKFLYLYSSEAMPKQHDANMLVAKAAHTRPDSNLKAQECCIKVSMLPLRLNIDQDSLLFLISFVNQFNAFSQKTKDEMLSEKKIHTKSEEPIMSIGNAANGQQNIIPNPLIQLNDEFDEHFGQKTVPVISKPDPGTSPNDSKAPIYIRQFVFSPDVTIRLDYEGRHVDLSQGSLAGLLMGLAQLNCSEITLKRIVHKHGLLGFDKLLTYITQEWLQDIKKHQLPSLLGGVGPMHSFVKLIQGLRDLVQLPIEQYQKDGRIVRGLQRGANSFTTSTAMAALEIATRIVNLIQRVAETTYDMVNPGPSMRQLRLQESKKKNRPNKRSHPADIREGVASAYMLVKEGIGETAQTIVRVASEEHEIKGTAGMVGGVMRQIPPTALTPIILASQATCNVLQGVRCQLAPDARVEAMQKWRCD